MARRLQLIMLKHLTLCKKKNHICNQIFTLSEKIRVVVLSLLRCWYFLILIVVEVKAFVSFKKRHNDEVFRVDNILPALNYVVPQKKSRQIFRHIPVRFLSPPNNSFNCLFAWIKYQKKWNQ